MSSCCWPRKSRGSKRSSESAVSGPPRLACAIGASNASQSNSSYLFNIIIDVKERSKVEWSMKMTVEELCLDVLERRLLCSEKTANLACSLILYTT